MGAAFDAHYQQHAVPILVRAIRLNAEVAALGEQTFGVALDNVMRTACFLGAGLLSADAFAALEHWVTDQVAHCLEAELEP